MMVSEFDAFGPWVYEINEEHPMPALFEAYCPPSDQALLQLKIPRDIERRKADPDMDLYDFVLSADETTLTILERKEKDIVQSQVMYSDIHAIRIFRKFLRGILSFNTVNGEVEIPFNTVSIDLMLRLVGMIRKRYLPADDREYSALADDSLAAFKNSETLYVNLLNELDKDGEKLYGGAYQESVPLLYGGSGMSARIRNRMDKPMTQSAAHLAGARELLVIEREKQLSKKQKQTYGYEYTYAPYAFITGIETAAATEYTGVNEVRIRTRQSSFAFYVSANNGALKSFYEKMWNVIGQ